MLYVTKMFQVTCKVKVEYQVNDSTKIVWHDLHFWEKKQEKIEKTVFEIIEKFCNGTVLEWHIHKIEEKEPNT